MPCLNEADTLAICIQKARKAVNDAKISTEIIIADNGSTDDSLRIAEKEGARIVHVDEKGYGNALMGGIEASLGKYVIMGDADDSYDFLEVPRFVEKLREGFDLVQGCRLPGGGGSIAPGAMPVLHRLIGNPFFTMLVRRWFHAPINDVYCGLRGFTRAHYDLLEQRCTGMEFATEMIIKSSLYQDIHGTRITEVPITLHVDGRTSHAPHLKTFRDGWRTLRFFMLYCPKWLYTLPSLILVTIALLLSMLVYARVEIGTAKPDAHTLLVSSLLLIMGYQSYMFGIFSKVFAVGERLIPPNTTTDRWMKSRNVERGIILGFTALVAGIAIIGKTAIDWGSIGFGNLNYSETMRAVIPGVTFAALGLQTILGSFFLGVLGMRRK